MTTSTNKLIDIDKEFDDVIFDETNIKRRTSCLESAFIRNQDPTYQSNRQAMFESEEWKKNHDSAVEKFTKDPEWRKNQKIAGEKRKNSQDWYDSFLEGNEKAVQEKHLNGTYEVWKEKMDVWRQSEEGKQASQRKSKRTKEMGKRNSRPVQTLNDGEFPSVTAASEFYGIGKATMSGRIRDHNDLYWFKDLGPGIAKRKKIKK